MSEDVLRASERIFKRVRQMAYSATLATLEKAANDLLANHIKAKFHFVTGNTINSIAVGIYYKGRCVSIISNAENTDGEPTMRTLREGQVYPLREYYDGTEPVDDEGNWAPYRGEYGKGGQWGPTLGIWRLRREHPAKRATWTMIVTIPVQYASHNDKIVKTFQGMMDDLPNVIDCNIVYIRDAPQQTTIPSAGEVFKQPHPDTPF